MRISNLVVMLEAVKRQHGDILVLCGQHRIAGVSIVKKPGLCAHILLKQMMMDRDNQRRN